MFAFRMEAPRQGTISTRTARPLRLVHKLADVTKVVRGRSRMRVRAESPIIEDIEVSGRDMSTRSVFNRSRWAYHQNTGRYARHMLSIFRSVTFHNLQAPMSFIVLTSCAVVLYRTLVDTGRLPDLFQGIRFTDVPFQLTSFALSLLLVFRTDASYGRWCAAMDAWGTLRTSAADLVRKAAAWVHDPAHLRRLVRWTAAFPACLMLELRYDSGTTALEAAVRQELGAVLRPHELEQVLSAGPHYHQFCLSVLTALVGAAQLEAGREAALLGELSGLNQAACECEKILRFPIPLTYTRHTSRFMLIYLTALPLALYDSCEWAAVPVTGVVSFLLLGIEDIGVQIEEPFSILPLPEICADLHLSAQTAVAQRDMVACLADPATCSAADLDLDPESVLERRADLQQRRQQQVARCGGGSCKCGAGGVHNTTSSNTASSNGAGGNGEYTVG
ncbi:hypothetical protein Agub_g92, partial [Astrephomene gubernaculifera]